MGLVWRGCLLLGTAGSQLRDVQGKQVTLGSCAGPCCELRGTGRPSCPLSQLLSPSQSHVLGTEGWDGAGLQAGAGQVWAWPRSVLRDMGVGCRCRSPAWVSVAEGPGAQSTVVVRCHRRRASSWLCLPHPAPGCAFPTQRRHLRFCASHAVVLGGARGAMDPDPSCGDFLGVRPAGTQTGPQTSGTGTQVLGDPRAAQLAAVATQEGSGASSPELPGRSANSGQGIPGSAMEPPKPRDGKAQTVCGATWVVR